MAVERELAMRPANLILSSLPEDEFRRVASDLGPVVLDYGQVLHYAGTPPSYVYFLDEGVASISVTNRNGVELELSIVGNESTVGERAIFSSDYFVINCSMVTTGSGHRMPPDLFRNEFERCGALHRMVINNLESRITETSLTALCNQTHPLGERLVRWLLTLADRSHHETLTITQEAIGNIMGVSRVSVTQAAQKLKEKGTVEYSRGVIIITDRKKLETLTCECYFEIKQALDAFCKTKGVIDRDA